MTLEGIGPDNWRHCATLEVEMTLLIYPWSSARHVPHE